MSAVASIIGVEHEAVRFEVPAGACDCHVHVYGDRAHYPLAPVRRATPGLASVDDLMALQRRLGLSRVVIVQPSHYGVDNRCTLDALQVLGGRGRAVAVIDDSIDDAGLDAMHLAGVRGVRLNVETHGVADPTAAAGELQALARRVERLGWHVQLFASLSMQAAMHDTLRTLPVPIVLDHFAKLPAASGVDEPPFRLLADLLSAGRTWIKLSAPHRISDTPDGSVVATLARRLIDLAPDRLLWGSDWPHPYVPATRVQGEGECDPFHAIDDGRALNRFDDWIGQSASLRQKILVDNPATLYQYPQETT